MKKPRRRPNLTERFAAVLLTLRDGNGEHIIPEPIRSASAKEIVAEFESKHQYDHARHYALGGGTEPQNLSVLTNEVHKEKTKGDLAAIAKAKRLKRSCGEFERRMAAKMDGKELETTKSWKRKIPSRPFPKRKGESHGRHD